MSHSFVPGTAGVYDAAELKEFVETLPTEEEQHHSMILIILLCIFMVFVHLFSALS